MEDYVVRDFVVFELVELGVCIYFVYFWKGVIGNVGDIFFLYFGWSNFLFFWNKVRRREVFIAEGFLEGVFYEVL